STCDQHAPCMLAAMSDDAITPDTWRRDARRGRADLHVHTLYSDGGRAPEAVVLAAAGRLDVVAITDHDRVAGGLRAREHAGPPPAAGRGREGGQGGRQ